MSRFDDGIPILTPCRWAMRQHRRAVEVVRRCGRITGQEASGHALKAVRCREKGLVFPFGLGQVVEWLGPDAKIGSLRARMAIGGRYMGHLFEFVKVSEGSVA